MKQSHTPAKGPSQRQLRVGELIRKVLAELFIAADIQDDDLKGAVVTVCQVAVSPDMRHATVFVMPLGGKDQDVVVAALNRHARFVRGELGHRIELKHVPDLRFALDTSFDEADRIAKLLHSPAVVRDLKS